jgi:hypothetical protein
MKIDFGHYTKEVYQVTLYFSRVEKGQSLIQIVKVFIAGK